MEKMSTAAFIIMESVAEPVRPQNVQVTDKNGLFYLSFDSCLQSFDVLNRNRREYKRSAIQKALEAPHIIELMENKSWFGEAGHPMEDAPARIMTIDPKNISHKIDSLRYEGNRLFGRVETLSDGSHGTRFTNHILQGMEPAFSLRALAALTKRGDGTSLVQGRAHIVAYDWVILPSHKEAYRDKRASVQQIIKNVNESGNTVKESFFPVNEASLMSYLQDESQNIKVISNVYDVVQESMTLSPDLKLAYLKEGTNTFAVRIEDKIQHDLRDYFSRL